MSRYKFLLFTVIFTAITPMAALAQTSTCLSLSADLAFGASGAQVTQLQTFLQSQGYFSATMVPQFGVSTLAAVRAFQQAKGISTTGTVGPMTRAAIQTASCGTSSTGSTTGTVIDTTTTTSGAFEISGWIPYWRSATGTADVLPHLNEITEVNPFVYTIKSDGTLVDNAGIDQEPWTSFIAAAKAQKVRVIPTIMTGNSDLLHSILSNPTKRVAFETLIANTVKANGFDGIDIDFEGKKAEDKDNFSTFLKGLYQRMGSKWVMCSIEARTPLDSRYYGTTVPPDAEVYANDFTQINKYCDRVEVMTYDQQNVDLALSAQAASSSQLYAPVADPIWVTKVINLMKQSISPKKILIGVPTYGYEYDVTAYANNEYNYDILWTFNPLYATQTAAQYGVTPQRNTAGEMYFTYISNTASSTLPISSNISADLAAAAASQFATQNNSHLDFRLVDWPDAISIAQKANLAKQLGVRGIAIFKWDGGEDPGMWAQLQGMKK